MPNSLRRSLQSRWHEREQNQRGGRGTRDGQGSVQPNPRAGRTQTAHSRQRGCQRRMRSVTVLLGMEHHAASAIDAGVASDAALTRSWMPRRLNRNVSSAEAR